MAMGIPVITNSGVGDVETIVKKYDAGFVLNDFSDESFHTVVNEIAAGKSFNHTAIRNGAKEFYALDTAIDRYRKVYEQIFSNTAAH